MLDLVLLLAVALAEEQSTELTMLVPRFNMTDFAQRGPALVPTGVGAAIGRARAACHYNDPFKGKCLPDEQNSTIVGVPGAICTGSCSRSKPCATDYCPDHSPESEAVCALKDDQGNEVRCWCQCRTRGAK